MRRTLANQQHSKLFVELWTMGGQKVFQKAYSNIENPLEIDLPPNLPNGLYLLRTFDEKGYVNGISKVIIQKQ